MNDRRYRLRRRWLAAAIFLLTFALYVATAEPTVSYWDCPEYVTTATRLEPGHPPGNPVWTLTARIFTLFAPSAESGPLMVNVMSGACSAVAVMLLFLTLTILANRLLPPAAGRWRQLTLLGGSAIGAVAFAVSDTFWFSAVEAEVYAMSAMLTALMLWLTFLWGENRTRPGASRYLILVAYVTGLAIGVHQLNLLVLPCLALIILFYRHDDIPKGVFAASIAVSVLIIAAVLFGMMPGVLHGASELELIMVNRLGLPLHSGAITYIGATLGIIIAAIALTSRRADSVGIIVAAVALWLSGLFSFGGSLTVGAVLSAAVAVGCLLWRRRISPVAINLAVWSVGFLFLGYCSYALILVRGVANPPMNQGAPSDIFALTSYLNRDQYGAVPLLYGRTPYSKPMFREEMNEDGTALYTKFQRQPGRPTYSPVADSTGRVRYAVATSNDKTVYTPELDMWFPRIHSSDPGDIESYKGWVGMTPDNMDEVEVSYAIDSAGNAVGRLVDGNRVREKALRPTYLQNFAMLGGYQMSYMYFRYLLWNFAGRQNEIYAQGEADAGNFLTGINPLDAIMLEHPELMPPDIGRDNPGHHVYWMLPLLLGVIGLAFQIASGKRGRRQAAVVGLLFILTGIAIVIYLNQTPGQPRERDYSFVGSFYAFSIWIGLGAVALLDEVGAAWQRVRRWLWRPVAVALCAFVVFVPTLMAVENFPDHNRARRTATRDFALNMLTPLPKNAILFVNGDNFTFPLWYLQESEGVRRDVRVVNLAYLGTTWYVPQLATETDGGRPVSLSLPAEHLNRVNLQRFAVADIGIGIADGPTEMRRFFSRIPDSRVRPRIDAGELRFPLPGGTDTITIDLRKMAGGQGYLRLNHLITLDILANNLMDRPVYWNDAVRGNIPVALRREGLNRRLIAETVSGDTLMQTARIILDQFRGGGVAAGAYIDLPGRQQVALHRHLIARTAIGLAERGGADDLQTADSLVAFSLRTFPSSGVSYGTFTDAGTPYSDALELAEASILLWEKTGDDRHRTTAYRLITDERRRIANYRRYLNSLSPRYRTYTKGSTRLTAGSDSTAVALLHRLNKN